MHRLILVWAGLMAATVAQGAARWLAYPGDYALWTGNELMPRRIERGHGYPPFWPSYMHHPSVRFLKPVELKSPAKVRVSAKGTFMVTAGGGKLSMSGDGDECTLPAGKYTLDVLVFSQQVPPALKIEGEGFATDESWRANWHAGEDLPADAFADDPALSPLRVERGKFAAVEKSGRELLGDLGREDFGFVTLTGVSGDGRARVIYAESETEAREDDESRLECWETVLLKKGDNRLKVSRGFRHLRVIPEGDLTVDGLAFEREYYPLDEVGFFHSNDERLNRIWKVSQYTLALTMREIPVEGAKRDRWTWSGDAIQSYLMNYYLFGNAKPVRDAIWYLRGGDPVVSHINNIMDYTYYWFVSVADYYRYTGDRRFLEQVYPRMVSLMDFVIGRLDAEGRPHDRPGDWVFIDWAPKALANYGGVTSFETMLLARALEAVAEVGESVGAAAKEVASCRDRAAQLRAWVKPTFWDESKGGLMHLKRDDGTLDPQFTRYPNIFGLFYGYFNDAEAKRVVDGVLLNDRVMKLQTPYMRFYELEALARQGLRKHVLDEIRSYWGAMLDAGATTFWELYNSDEKGAARYAMYGRPYGKSLCHAWGASPAYLLGRYFLGVEPTKPGFAEYVVAPDPADLALMEGAVPTPSGAVKVRVENGRVRVTGNGGKGVLRWRGREYPIAPRATVSAPVSSRAEAGAVVAVCEIGEDRVVRAELNYTAGRGDWVKREWKGVPMTLTANGTQGVLVDNRLDMRDVPGGQDFITPEQTKAPEWPTLNGERFPWETCQTFSGSWGYSRDEMTWKSPAQLIELLAETVSKGGNLIMNVGPTARGRFDARALDRLAAFGKWMDANGRAIYGCTQAPDEFKAPTGSILTYNPATRRLYVILKEYPMGRLMFDFDDKVDFAQFLHDGSEIKLKRHPYHQGTAGFAGGREVCDFVLPMVKPDVELPVIEVMLK